jgi:hypothetical protein
MFEMALEYAQLGWCVFPLAPGSKLPAIPKAKGGRGVHDATNDLQQIETWIQTYRRCNIGIACGSVSGILVVDIDPRNGGHVALAKLAQQGKGFPIGPRQRTGNGGIHILLKFDPLIAGNKDKLGRGIDVKATGGYIVAAPSEIGPSDSGPGGAYAWTKKPGMAVPPAPLWMRTMLKSNRRQVFNSGGVSGDLAPLARSVSRAQGGYRNNMLFWAACRAGEMVARREISEREATVTLTQAALAAGLSADEVGKTIASGLNAGSRR